MRLKRPIVISISKIEIGGVEWGEGGASGGEIRGSQKMQIRIFGIRWIQTGWVGSTYGVAAKSVWPHHIWQMACVASGRLWDGRGDIKKTRRKLMLFPPERCMSNSFLYMYNYNCHISPFKCILAPGGGCPKGTLLPMWADRHVRVHTGNMIQFNTLLNMYMGQFLWETENTFLTICLHFVSSLLLSKKKELK